VNNWLAGQFLSRQGFVAICFSFEWFGNFESSSGPYRNSQTAAPTDAQNTTDAKTTTKMAVSIPYTVVFISALSE
jgi:uncharacterized protein YpmB